MRLSLAQLLLLTLVVAIVLGIAAPEIPAAAKFLSQFEWRVLLIFPMVVEYALNKALFLDLLGIAPMIPEPPPLAKVGDAEGVVGTVLVFVSVLGLFAFAIWTLWGSVRFGVECYFRKDRHIPWIKGPLATFIVLRVGYELFGCFDGMKFVSGFTGPFKWIPGLREFITFDLSQQVDHPWTLLGFMLGGLINGVLVVVLIIGLMDCFEQSAPDVTNWRRKRK